MSDIFPIVTPLRQNWQIDRSHMLYAGLSAYWAMGHPRSIAQGFPIDLTDSKNHASTLSGTITPEFTSDNRYVSDFTTGAYYDMGSTNYIDKTQPFSVAMLVYAEGSGNHSGPLSLHVVGQTARQAFVLHDSTSWGGFGMGSCTNDPLKVGLNSNQWSTLFVDRWAHAVFTYNGSGSTTLGNYKIYVDGIDRTITSADWGCSGSDVNRIGHNGFTGLNGKVGDVIFWGNRELTAAEVYSLYRNQESLVKRPEPFVMLEAAAVADVDSTIVSNSKLAMMRQSHHLRR